MSVISITENKSYCQEEINEAVKLHFERFSIKEKLKPGMKVTIKPNLLMKRKPEEFTTTHPSLVEGTILFLQEIGIRDITVADSPGGLYTASALKGIYEASGMAAVCEKTGAKLNFDTGFENVGNETAKLVKSFPIINPVAQADFLIDICKLKSHGMTGLSGGVKNLFGCIPGLTKPEFHWRFPQKELFCQMLVDLCETVQPDFVLTDAVVSMEGNGPSGGTKRETGLILASDSPYDLDYYLSWLIGLEPQEILTVKAAVEDGLCVGCLEDLELIGFSPKRIMDFKLPQDMSVDFISHVPGLFQKPVKAVTKRFLTTKPAIRKKDCVGCGKCAESCPAKTIQITDGKAQINYSKCIRCFCCHEMCPVKAIDMKRSRLFSR